MDARERLRLYLEQRRDMGETELVLDTLSVDEVLKLVGARSTGPSGGGGTMSAAPPASVSRTPTSAGTLDAQEHAATDDPMPRRELETPEMLDAASTGDWRAALRAAGSAPQSARPASDTAPAPETTEADMVKRAAARKSADRDEAKSAPAKAEPIPGIDAPPGLEVGGSRVKLGAPFDSLDSLEAIAKKVAKCTRCDLYRTATNPVPGEGNPHADLVCVGEAPGATEDATGRPFVGQSGELLTKILAAIKLTREEVFICNVLKHRPPGNRNPTPDEVEACSPYLVRQLELIRPKVIVAFGTFAAQTLLNTKTPLGQLRGAVHRYYGIPLVVTYHPAALLRNPNWKRPTWEDVQLARRILDRASDS